MPFWLLGSLSLARWSSVGIAVLGDDTARAPGVSPARFRVQALAVVSLAVGAVVAISGGIGFVGLIVPHVARLCVDGAHRRVFPVAALIGAVFLVWADVCARIVFAPRELSLGIVTAVVGAPLLVILVRRFHAMTT